MDSLHRKLHNAEERILTLRADLDRQRTIIKDLRSLLAETEQKLEEAQGKKRSAEEASLDDSEDEELSEEMEDGSDSSDSDKDDSPPKPMKRNRPKLGRYKKVDKNPECIAEESHSKFNQRKAKLLYEHLDTIYGASWRKSLSGQPDATADSGITFDRGAAALKINMIKLLNEHYLLWNAILREKKVAEQVEASVSARIRAHWERQALQMFSRCAFTQDGWQCLINLLSHFFNPESGSLERLVFPSGIMMPLMKSLSGVLAERDHLAASLGLTSTQTSAMFDPKKALVKRLQALDSKGLLRPSPLFGSADTLVVQFMADATSIYSSTHTQGTAAVFRPEYDDSGVTDEGQSMSSINNVILLALFAKDDSYDAMCQELPGLLQQIADLMRDGVTVNDRHWKLVIPMGGDLKLLAALLGLAGGSSEFACLYCEASTHQYHISKREWDKKGGAPCARDFARILRLQHFPEAQQYTCPSPSCRHRVDPTDGQPKLESQYGKSERLSTQKKHFSLVPGRLPFLPISISLYVIDVLHLVLRLVPQIFRQTVQQNTGKEQLQAVAQWCYENLDVVISDKVYLQTTTGMKQLSVSAESWPGKTCRRLMDSYRDVLKIALPNYDTTDQPLYGVCCRAWSCFYYLTALVTDGCSDDLAARQEYGASLDTAGAEFLDSYIAVSSAEAVRSPYLHITACHLGDIARRWGSLARWSSQPVEALHQWIHFFSRHRSNRRQWVTSTAKNVMVKQSFAHLPARRQQVADKRRDAAGSLGHAPVKERREHAQIKQEIIAEHQALRAHEAKQRTAARDAKKKKKKNLAKQNSKGTDL